MEELANVNWPGLALGYYGYRAAKYAYSKMPGQKRKSTLGANVQGFRKRFRLRQQKRNATTFRFPMYKQPMVGRTAGEYKVCTFKDITSHQQSGAVTTGFYEQVTPQQLASAEGIGRQTELFNHIKVLSMKVEFMVTSPAAILTCTQLDDATIQGLKPFFEKQHTLRVHQAQPVGHFSRTLDLQQKGSFRDFIKCEDFYTDITSAQYLASIKWAAFDLPLGLNLTIIKTWVCAFHGARDTTPHD
jgi:hypothetical protein